MTTTTKAAEEFLASTSTSHEDACLHIRALLGECGRLSALAIKALDDIDKEAEAFESLENAQANFSSSNPEARAYGIAMVRASKSSKALREAALSARKEQTS